jgi:hypothetical protein
MLVEENPASLRLCVLSVFKPGISRRDCIGTYELLNWRSQLRQEFLGMSGEEIGVYLMAAMLAALAAAGTIIVFLANRRYEKPKTDEEVLEDNYQNQLW